MCEREDEILHFKPDFYWSVEAALVTKGKQKFTASLTKLDGHRLKKMSISTEEQAEEAVSKVKSTKLFVQTTAEKEVREKPSAPYRTSTLQQDAGSKLRWTSMRTMKVAQSLYDGRNNKGQSLVSSFLLRIAFSRGQWWLYYLS